MINYVISEIYRVAHLKSFYAVNLIGTIYVLFLGISDQLHDNFENYFYGMLMTSVVIMPLIITLYIKKSRDVEGLIASYRFTKTNMVLGDFFAGNTLLAIMYLYYFLVVSGLRYFVFDSIGDFNVMEAILISYVICMSMNGMMIGLSYIGNRVFSVTFTFLFFIYIGLTVDEIIVSTPLLEFLYYHSSLTAFDRLVGTNMGSIYIIKSLFTNLLIFAGGFLYLGSFVYNKKRM